MASRFEAPPMQSPSLEHEHERRVLRVSMDDVAQDPRSFEEYQTRMRDLRFALGVARKAHDYAAIAAIGRKIAPLDLWGRQHQPRDPTQLGAGVALAIVGGATLIAGLVALIAGELSNCSSGGNGLNFSFGPDCAGDHALTTAGALMMLGGGVSALVSIPLIVTANRKTVDTTPRARLDVGLTRVGLSVSF